jgi:rhodanese-related sulfurtransferase
MKTAADLIADAKSRIQELSPDEVRALRERGERFHLVDVREGNEWNLGRIPGATFIPRGVLESTIEPRIPRDEPVVLYCASGNRSALAADVLQQMGYADVRSMRGGIRGWADAGGDVET